MLRVQCPYLFCIPETRVSGTHCPAPEGGNKDVQTPTCPPKHLISSQWNSGGSVPTFHSVQQLLVATIYGRPVTGWGLPGAI